MTATRQPGALRPATTRTSLASTLGPADGWSPERLAPWQGQVSPCRRGMPPRLCRTHWRGSAGRGLGAGRPREAHQRCALGGGWSRSSGGLRPDRANGWDRVSPLRVPTAFDAALGEGGPLLQWHPAKVVLGEGPSPASAGTVARLATLARCPGGGIGAPSDPNWQGSTLD